MLDAATNLSDEVIARITRQPHGLRGVEGLGWIIVINLLPTGVEDHVRVEPGLGGENGRDVARHVEHSGPSPDLGFQAA